MSDTPLLNVAVNVPLSRTFDYAPLPDLPLASIGSRVRVPFGRRQVVGLVVGHRDETDVPREKIRRVSEYLDDAPLIGDAELSLLRFASDYYHHPIGEVVAAALPSQLRQGKPKDATTTMVVATDLGASADLMALQTRAPRQAELLQCVLDAGGDGCETEMLNDVLPNWRRAAKGLFDKGYAMRVDVPASAFDEHSGAIPQPGPSLNKEQQQALASLSATDQFAVHLLDGVTGSGKTEVYLQRMQQILDQGRQILVLVPEIGLTPQLLSRFRERLGLQPALLHSGLSDVERLTAWRAAQNGSARLVIGTRSAVFVPLKDPGLIIVDEEHDPSLKQQEGLRYSARDLAIVRAKNHNIPCVLGSATPTLEMMQHCNTGLYERIILSRRAGDAIAPTLRLIDTQRSPTTDGISEPLAAAIREHLASDGQALIFLNRRGFAPTLICAACAHIAGCTRCDARMTVHAKQRQLKCHHCGHARALNAHCEDCGEPVRPLGEGTERLEESLRQRFVNTAIRRIDSDSTQQKGAMDRALQEAIDGSAEILVGTQMLSKGHHFPKLTLVGIVNADQGLFGTDFRSSERMAQSVIQVAGRAGREHRAGEVLIQTAFADHPFWETLLSGGYHAVAAAALLEREQTHWPPYSRLALIRAAAHQKTDAESFLRVAANKIEAQAISGLRALGPVAAPMARKAGRYRAQLLLQSADRASLHRMLAFLRPQLELQPEARRVRWSIDVDPIELF